MPECTFKRAQFGHVPVLLAFQGDPGTAAEKGCVLFFHGLGASKDVQRPDLESLAAAGYLVVGVDSVGHGERRYPDFDRRLSKTNPDFTREFLAVVIETAREVPFLVDALEQTGLIRNGHVGIAGISQGGFITYTAVTLEPRHDHHYERFAPQTAAGVADPRGLRQFLVGTGGKSHYAVTGAKPNSEVRDGNTHGVLELKLAATGYT